jgi:hypothetical protein
MFMPEQNVFIQQDPNIKRRRKLAEAMMADQKPIRHWSDGLSNAAKSIAGALINKKIDTQEQEQEKKKREILSRVLSGENLTPQEVAAQMMQFPETHDYGAQMKLSQIMNKPERKVMADAMGRKRYADTGDFVFSDMSAFDKNVLSDAALEQKRQIARDSRSNVNVNTGNQYPGLSKLGEGRAYKRNPDGSLYINEQGIPEAVAIPGSKAAGELSPKEKTASAKSRVSGNLGTLADHYRKLDKLSAAVNVEKSTIDNVLASLRASDFGQALGRFAGTDEQSVRNMINSMRPTLVNDIRQASEMGAKGMDSEKELEFFLQAATDPKRDLQSNMAALKVLDNAYGLGDLDISIDQSVTDGLNQEFKNLSQPTPARPQTEADYNALPSGAMFIDPDDGKVYRKP